jgi:hypothetical protein
VKRTLLPKSILSAKKEVVSGLLHSISGLLAILDEKRRFFFLTRMGASLYRCPEKRVLTIFIPKPNDGRLSRRIRSVHPYPIEIFEKETEA